MGTNMLYNRIYNTLRASPDFLRKLLYMIPLEYRLGGKPFIDTYNLLKETEHWTQKQLYQYQAKQLQHLLSQAVNHTKFYAKISLSSDPYRSLQLFPLIDKDTIQENFDDFQSDNIPRKNTYYVTTGGTSGNTLGFYLDNATIGKEWAFIMTGWRQVGFTPGDRIVSFRGVECKNAKKKKFWQDNPIYNMLEMSTFHMSEDNLPRYVEKIKQFKPSYIHGYPSAITLLAHYLLKTEESLPSIKAILAISENIYMGQRELIEKAFNARLFSFYGMSEKAIMAHECEYDTRYHAFLEYGVTEILHKDGTPVAEGEQGELVGTGFLNHCLPFIRYRTGDYATLSRQTCRCGRPYLIFENLRGRWYQEMILGKSGALISLAALNLHSDAFRNVHRFQLHQNQQGKITLKLMPKSTFKEEDKEKIRGAFHKKIGDDLDIAIKEVEDIELTERGKSKLFIQELKLGYEDYEY